MSELPHRRGRGVPGGLAQVTIGGVATSGRTDESAPCIDRSGRPMLHCQRDPGRVTAAYPRRRSALTEAVRIGPYTAD